MPSTYRIIKFLEFTLAYTIHLIMLYSSMAKLRCRTFNPTCIAVWRCDHLLSTCQDC